MRSTRCGYSCSESLDSWLVLSANHMLISSAGKLLHAILDAEGAFRAADFDAPPAAEAHASITTRPRACENKSMMVSLPSAICRVTVKSLVELNPMKTEPSPTTGMSEASSSWW